MLNIFITLQDALKLEVNWRKVDPLSYWRFILSLPMKDLETLYFAYQKEGEDMLRVFIDTHPLWLAQRFNEREMGDGLPLINWDDNKYRFANTVYELLDEQSYDLAATYLRLCELATQDTLRFAEWTDNPEAREFYSRCYTMVGWAYVFTSPNWFHDLFWKGPFLVNGIRTGLDITGSVVRYINTFHTVRVRREIINDIKNLLEQNKTMLHPEENLLQPGKTIAQWIKQFTDFSPTVEDVSFEALNTVVENFIKAHVKEELALSETDGYVLMYVLSLYNELRSRLFDVPDAEWDFVEEFLAFVQRKDFSEEFGLEILRPTFLEWATKQPSGAAARREIVRGLVDRIKIAPHVNSLLALNEWLQTFDPQGDKADIIYYSAEDKGFHWNEDIILGAQP